MDKQKESAATRLMGTGILRGAADMKIQVRHFQGRIKIVDCVGKLTLGEGTLALREVVLNLFDEGQTKIILNFDKVSHLDGAALGELVGCWKRARAVGTEIKLLKLSHRLAQMMEMTKVSSLFGASYSQESDAIASFREPQHSEPLKLVPVETATAFP